MIDSLFSGLVISARFGRSLRLAAAATLLLSLPATATTTPLDDILSPLAQPSLREQVPTLSPSITAEVRDELAKGAKQLASGDAAGAVATARAVTQAVPDAAEGWHLLGLALANDNQMEDAVVALGKAADLYRKNAQPLIAQGEILVSLGRRDEAMAALKAATERDPSDWRGFEALAALQERSGDLAAAKANYEVAMSLAPKGQDYSRFKLARMALAANDGATALELLKPVTSDPDASNAALDLLAAAQLQTGDTAGAIATYQGLIARGSDLPAFIGLSRLQIRDGAYDDAEATLKQAVSNFPDQPAPYFELGNLYGARTQYRQALETYSVGLTKAPDDPALTKGASIVEMRLGNTADAMVKATALTRRPDATSSDFAWLASLQEMSGDLTGAQESYRTAIERDPNNWLALNNLSSLLTDSDPTQALALARQAVALAPDVTAVRDTAAWALYKSGDAVGAVEAFKALLAAEPSNAITLYRLGVAEIAAGHDAEGRDSVKAALAADPAFKYAAEARSLLGLD